MSLRTTFFQIDVTVLAVETADGTDQKSYDDYMITQGYVNYKHIKFVDEKAGLNVDDTIFVKKTYLIEQGLLPPPNGEGSVFTPIRLFVCLFACLSVCLCVFLLVTLRKRRMNRIP